MKNPAALAAFAVCWTLATLQSVVAMSVSAPTFPELVAESATIVRARVTGVVSRRVDTPQGEIIKTFVTFEVSQPLKGAPAPKLTLSFVGGQVGLDRLDVPGMPQFERGTDEFLFVSGKPGICPLVGAMHGRFRVLTEQKAGRPYVARDDHSALVHLGDVALPIHDGAPRAASVAAAITPEAFAAAIAAEVARPSSNQP